MERSGSRRLAALAAAGALSSGVAACPLSLDFSTYYGGSKGEEVRDVAADAGGNIVVAGATSSADFPVTPSGYQTQHNPGTPESPQVTPNDVFVSKLDPSGQQVLWATYLGGPNHDRAYGVEVGRDGSVYLCGRAGRGFPVTAGAFRTTFGGHSIQPPPASFYGQQDGFVARLSADGSTLLWAGFLGTNGFEFCRDIDVDPSGNAYVVAPLPQDATPYPASWFPSGVTPRGGQDLMVAKIDPSGSRVVWATYLGGSGDELGEASIRVDPAGNVVVLTATDSDDAPTTSGVHDRTFNGRTDFYVASLAGSSGALRWATYVGGSSGEMVETHELAVDEIGNVILSGETGSADYPTTAGAADPLYGSAGQPPGEAVVTKLGPDGSLLASTFLGGSASDAAEGIATDPGGNVFVTGHTTSDDFPVTVNAFQPRKSDDADGFVVELSADLTTILYATFLGGRGHDMLRGAAVDDQGHPIVGGRTSSPDWPVDDGVQRELRGAVDGVFAKFVPVAGELPLP